MNSVELGKYPMKKIIAENPIIPVRIGLNMGCNGLDNQHSTPVECGRCDRIMTKQGKF